MSKGTADALGVSDHHRTHVANKNETFSCAGWRVVPIELQHDAAEPIGFLIEPADRDDSLLFIPDTAFIENRIYGVGQIAVECNHIGDVLSDNIINGHLPAVVGRRVRRNHMSLETLIHMLKSNDLSHCRRIFLLHLSDINSDEKRMVREVQEATGIPTEAVEA